MAERRFWQEERGLPRVVGVDGRSLIAMVVMGFQAVGDSLIVLANVLAFNNYAGFIPILESGLG